MHDLQKAFEECKAECASCCIKLGKISEIKVNYRAESRWGLCEYVPTTRSYVISISYKLIDDSTPIKSLKQTILHELCHTIKGGNCHTGEWARAVAKLNRVYGYNIQRTNSVENLGVDAEKFPPKRRSTKYAVRCESCGQVISRAKMSKVIQNPEDYRCGECGGKLTRIL